MVLVEEKTSSSKSYYINAWKVEATHGEDIAGPGRAFPETLLQLASIDCTCSCTLVKNVNNRSDGSRDSYRPVHFLRFIRLSGFDKSARGSMLCITMLARSTVRCNID